MNIKNGKREGKVIAGILNRLNQEEVVHHHQYLRRNTLKLQEKTEVRKSLRLTG
jgi:hypothetical protein